MTTQKATLQLLLVLVTTTAFVQWADSFSLESNRANHCVGVKAWQKVTAVSIKERKAALLRVSSNRNGKQDLRCPNSKRTAALFMTSSFIGNRKRRMNAPFTQVVSDVDDTLKSSGGVNVAGVALGGIDVQYPRGEFYPGVAEFMLYVSLGTQTQLNLNDAPPPKVAILTARAEEFKAALELKQDSSLAIAFRNAGETIGIQNWGLGPVLYGSVAEWIVQDRKGLRKFRNFERLIQQDPTGVLLQYVYVGDTGELDQEAGETMLREYPEVVKAVFLHVVSDVKDIRAPIPAHKFINGRPVIFFRTYVGAAVAAVQLGFMTLDGLESVIAASRKKLIDEPKTSDKWLDLKVDLDRANRLLLL